jgi:hypothetical protein
MPPHGRQGPTGYAHSMCARKPGLEMANQPHAEGEGRAQIGAFGARLKRFLVVEDVVGLVGAVQAPEFHRPAVALANLKLPAEYDAD